MSARAVIVAAALGIVLGMGGCGGPQAGVPAAPAASTVGAPSAPLTMRYIGGWNAGVLGEFKVQPDGSFTWVKEQQVRIGRLPAPELDAVLKAVAEAGPVREWALDAGEVEFSWLDGNGVVQKSAYSYPQGEQCAGLLRKIEELATKYGAAPEETRDLNRAVALAVAAFDATTHANEEYKITDAHLIVKDNRYVWWVTFRAARSLSPDPAHAVATLGGETFVAVDLNTGNTTITHGE